MAKGRAEVAMAGDSGTESRLPHLSSSRSQDVLLESALFSEFRGRGVRFPGLSRVWHPGACRPGPRKSRPQEQKQQSRVLRGFGPEAGVLECKSWLCHLSS